MRPTTAFVRVIVSSSVNTYTVLCCANELSRRLVLYQCANLLVKNKEVILQKKEAEREKRDEWKSSSSFRFGVFNLASSPISLSFVFSANQQVLAR